MKSLPTASTAKDGPDQNAIVDDVVAAPEAPSPEVARQFLTVAEVARWFGVSPRTARAWIKAGKLPVVRIGHKPFVPIAAITALGTPT